MNYDHPDAGIEGTGTFLRPGENPEDVSHAEIRRRTVFHYSRVHHGYDARYHSHLAGLRALRENLAEVNPPPPKSEPEELVSGPEAERQSWGKAKPPEQTGFSWE